MWLSLSEDFDTYPWSTKILSFYIYGLIKNTYSKKAYRCRWQVYKSVNQGWKLNSYTWKIGWYYDFKVILLILSYNVPCSKYIEALCRVHMMKILISGKFRKQCRALIQDQVNIKKSMKITISPPQLLIHYQCHSCLQFSTNSKYLYLN